MRPIFLKELQTYTIPELKEKLSDLEVSHFENVLKELQDRKILMTREDKRFSIQFVGVLIIKGLVVFCLPKFIQISDEKTVIKQLLTLFREYSKRENLDQDDIESLGNVENNANYNMLSLIIYLISEYIENGLYSNEKSIHLLMGENEINWQKTIDEFQPVIDGVTPVYLEYYTSATLQDEENYFRLLHQFVLNECTEILKRTGLQEYFGFEPVHFEVNDDAFGTPQDILSRIQNELNVQFVKRKQMVLKALYSFISREQMEHESLLISFYGTRKFEIVWEKVCSYILDNKYPELKDYVDKPNWITTTGKTHHADTLIPDIISMYQSERNYFIISDAKYYSLTLTDTKLSNNPGVGDVTKQYLYQLAFTDYIQQNQIHEIRNLLLFPTEKNEIEQIGKVTIGFLQGLNLEDVQLLKLPAQKVFDMYIRNRRLNLNWFINKLLKDKALV
ncbi:LlaJI family restriction endonuclease [Neobacillus sp. CF12]|uniref:LlaJI family restriction endonuclease n=1 Tax=Neobacillus sp. CF12 TaxID=3055864 RepID=UPI0025A0FC0D|nr:LlaJI family restriction endonuclease [Neobacillus sp. CF12]MDM5326846.1 LlaJI family restriction endonuclease [Neobacillus sp. CF12]